MKSDLLGECVSWDQRHIRQHAITLPGIIMPAVPRASREVGMRVVEVINASKADCDELCQFHDVARLRVCCITFTGIV